MPNVIMKTEGVFVGDTDKVVAFSRPPDDSQTCWENLGRRNDTPRGILVSCWALTAVSRSLLTF